MNKEQLKRYSLKRQNTKKQELTRWTHMNCSTDTLSGTESADTQTTSSKPLRPRLKMKFYSTIRRTKLWDVSVGLRWIHTIEL